MNEQRKQIIISEIKHWKQSQLLPSHYCDFLITLYAQGDEEAEDVDVSKSVLIQERKRLNRRILTLLLLAIIGSTSLFVFVAYPAVTFSLSAAILLYMLFLGMRSSVAKSALLPFTYIFSALLLLMMSLKIWLAYFEAFPMLLIALLILNCGLWLFVGRLLKLLYFTISGAAGILLIVIFMFLQL